MNAVNPAAEAATPKCCPSCGTRYPADALFCALDGAPLTTSPGAIAAAAATDPYVGREILGHIEIRQLVGIGAMGRVYRAFQKGIDRDVAVKILHRELSANQMLVTRFHREARVASRLAHPNVVHVLLTGQLPDGALYIVMEYLDGLSLQSALGAAGGAMPLPRALHVALQLCDAAGEAHSQGVVHRDLKPENVMLVRRADDPDYVKVLDFGIARLNWGEQSMATAAGLIFGTARYISPEGAQGEKVSPQGDVYSIATIVYQMLSGRTPFDGDQAVALLVQQIHDPPAPLKSVPRAAYVPDPIAGVVMTNLAKRAEDRAENARAFGRALLDAAVTSGLSAQDILARPAMLGPARGQHVSAVQLPSMQRTNKLQLEPDVASRIAAKTSYETPAESVTEPRPVLRTEIPEPAMVKPGASTTKWIPPEEFAPRLLPPTVVRAPDSEPPGRPAPPPSSPGVDMTMDDSQVPSRVVPLSTPGPMSAPNAPRSEPAPPPSRQAPPSSKPPSRVEGTVLGDDPPPRLPRTHGRMVAVVLACFLVGLLGMGIFAYRAGLLGTHARQNTDYAAMASEALAQHRWEAVRDLTDKGLARVPNDPVLVQLRARAGAEALGGARTKAAAGDTKGATQLIELATQLDPSAGDPEALLEGMTPPPETEETSPAIPPLAPSHTAAVAAGGTRAMVDVSNPRPGVGQPVDLAGRLAAAPHARVDGAAFHVAGPGIAPGTRLDANDDGSGVYRATFTFLQAGRFEVSFTARADGTPVRSSRQLVVGAASPAPLPAAGPTVGPASASPAPTDSAKWL